MFSSGMLDGFAKSFFKYLQSDEQMHKGVMDAIEFVRTLDARLALIERQQSSIIESQKRIMAALGVSDIARPNGADNHA